MFAQNQVTDNPIDSTAETIVILMVSGRVQGVGYRVWTEKQAKRLGLTGWVRNHRDGRVEICLMGSPQAIAELETLAAKGPSLAKPTAVARQSQSELLATELSDSHGYSRKSIDQAFRLVETDSLEGTL